MIYIRNLFNQDLRDGKQIAFPKEPSNILFKFNFNNQDPDRKISFKFKEKDKTSPNFLQNDKIINTRLYSAGSESRIDGELKQFLRDILKAEVDDVLLFRAISLEMYEFEYIPKGNAQYNAYKAILNNKNHEIIIEGINKEDISLIKSNNIREFLFDVFKFLQKEFGEEFLIEKSAIAKRKFNVTNYEAFIFPDYFKTQSILGSFEEEQSEDSLKSSNTLRYFPENIKILDQKYIYFTTQWGFPQFQFSPSFISFNKFVLDYSKNKYKIEYDEIAQFYKLELNNFQKAIPQIAFDIESFQLKAGEAGLIFSPQLINRFIASMCTKPFVICTGLSGSGKTKLAQAFAEWISADESQYKIIPVGADWTNREPLLGYPNALNKDEYVSSENGVLDLMIRAKLNIENPEEQTKPYFLILDEMNLSHVERYFADFLSTMESGDKIPLHKIESESQGIPQSIKLPKNLFIIGTVNIDETTYMFSPKVLDRANTIEFRLTEKDLEDFIASDIKLDMEILTAQGANMAESFMELALRETDKNLKQTENELKQFFSELKKSGAEFGYRTTSEIGRLMYMLKEMGEAGDNLLDIAIMQKLLPKLHGSRNKLTKVLPILGGFCLADPSKIKEDYLDKFLNNNLSEDDLIVDEKVKYKISFEKICRMYKNAVENGFASYAEA
jgi:5-methylcytosine-specific restriction enzyme B